jgi:hypothetical protein
MLKFYLVLLSLSLAIGLRGSSPSFDHSIPEVWSGLDDVTAMERYRSQILKSFQDGDFAALEAEAAYVLESKEKLPCGDWWLFHFYDSFSHGLTIEGLWDTDAILEAKSKGWVEAYPQSVAAWLARAEFSGRNAQFKSQLMFRKDPEKQALGRKGYNEGLEERRKASVKAYELDKAAAIHNPYLWFNLANVANGGAAPGAPTRAECIAHAASEVEFHYLWMEQAWYTAPFGMGSKEELASFLEKNNAGKGPAFWFLAASWLSRGGHDDLFAITDLDYKKVKSSYLEFAPKTRSLALVGRMAYLACLAEDREFARDLFGKLGQRYETMAWSKGEAAHQPYLRPFLESVGVDNPVELEAWSRATDGGKDKKGIKRWNDRPLTAARDAAMIFSGNLDEVRAAFDQIETESDEAGSAVGNALLSLRYAGAGGAPVPPEFSPLIQARRESPGERAYVVLLVDKANVDCPGGWCSRVSSAADMALALIGPGVAAGLDYMLTHMGERRRLKDGFYKILAGASKGDDRVLAALAGHAHASEDPGLRTAIAEFLDAYSPEEAQKARVAEILKALIAREGEAGLKAKSRLKALGLEKL